MFVVKVGAKRGGWHPVCNKKVEPREPERRLLRAERAWGTATKDCGRGGIGEGLDIDQLIHSLILICKFSIREQYYSAGRMYPINGLNSSLRSVGRHVPSSLSRQTRSLHVSGRK